MSKDSDSGNGILIRYLTRVKRYRTADEDLMMRCRINKFEIEN